MCSCVMEDTDGSLLSLFSILMQALGCSLCSSCFLSWGKYAAMVGVSEESLIAALNLEKVGHSVWFIGRDVYLECLLAGLLSC